MKAIWLAIPLMAVAMPCMAADYQGKCAEGHLKAELYVTAQLPAGGVQYAPKYECDAFEMTPLPPSKVVAAPAPALHQPMPSKPLPKK